MLKMICSNEFNCVISWHYCVASSVKLSILAEGALTHMHIETVMTWNIILGLFGDIVVLE